MWCEICMLLLLANELSSLGDISYFTLWCSSPYTLSWQALILARRNASFLVGKIWILLVTSWRLSMIPNFECLQLCLKISGMGRNAVAKIGFQTCNFTVMIPSHLSVSLWDPALWIILACGAISLLSAKLPHFKEKLSNSKGAQIDRGEKKSLMRKERAFCFGELGFLYSAVTRFFYNTKQDSCFTEAP